LPHHRSAIKRLRQDEKIKARNRAIKSAVKTAAKKVRQAPDRKDALKALPESSSVIDRAAKKRVIHWRTAARIKSRLARHANTRSA
jgi:small subunit ribosomal protein S20